MAAHGWSGVPGIRGHAAVTWLPTVVLTVEGGLQTGWRF